MVYAKNFCLFVTVKRKIIVADSGGTKTDWCIVDDTGNEHFFSTDSYHPRMLNDSFLEEAKQFWLDQNVFDYSLFFFGAGCLQVDKKQLMTDFFGGLGFKSVDVQSDLIGAGLALNGGNGWGAICGTGSVVFRLENGELKELRGGLGRALGDEGSGYYFGKLVSEAFQKNELSDEVMQRLQSLDLIPEIYATLALQLHDLKNDPSIMPIHEANVRLLRDRFLHQPTQDGECITSVSIVGSYAFHHQEIFQRIFLEHDIQIKSLLERPIIALTNYLLASR